MRLELEADPHAVEMTLIKFIIPDAALMFFSLWIVSGAALFVSEILDLRMFVLAMLALGILSLVLTAVRFYGYWTTVVRVMGSLTHLFEEFGDGKAKAVVEYPQPFLLFGFLFSKRVKKSPAKDYSFSLKTDSQKYKLDLACLVRKGAYDLKIKVTDWHGLTHDRDLKGNVAFLQKSIFPVAQAIRQEVLESRGITLKESEPHAPGIALPVPKPPELQAPPTISPKRVAKPLSPPPPSVAKKPVPTTVAAVEKEIVQVEEKLVDSAKKKEQEALKDALYELEELEKMLKA